MPLCHSENQYVALSTTPLHFKAGFDNSEITKEKNRRETNVKNAKAGQRFLHF